jgi:hypothetical protein
METRHSLLGGYTGSSVTEAAYQGIYSGWVGNILLSPNYNTSNSADRRIRLDFLFPEGLYGANVATGQESVIFAGYASGNYQLGASSPAKDMGDSTYYPATVDAFLTTYYSAMPNNTKAAVKAALEPKWNLDLLGHDRRNGTIDIGAYELWP